MKCMKTQVRATTSSICATARTAVVMSGHTARKKSRQPTFYKTTKHISSCQNLKNINAELTCVVVVTAPLVYRSTGEHRYMYGARGQQTCKVAARCAVKARKCLKCPVKVTASLPRCTPTHDICTNGLSRHPFPPPPPPGKYDALVIPVTQNATSSTTKTSSLSRHISGESASLKKIILQDVMSYFE